VRAVHDASRNPAFIDTIMRIFLTGGTGYIGSAVLDALLRAGIEVRALVRTPDGADGLSARGAHPITGNLGDPASWQEAASGVDGWIHAAIEDSERRATVDRTAIETLLRAADGQPGVFIYTSGVWILGHQRAPVDERAAVNPPPIVAWRPEHERLVLAAGTGRLRTVIVRPGLVYGGARGMVAELFKDALNGLMRVVGGGENRWPLVYERDLGDLYLRLATSTDAAGVYHANDEGDERVIDVVEAIAGAVPAKPDVRRMPLEEARAKIGPVADALVLDQVVRSPRAKALGWSPQLRSVAGSVSRLLEEFRRKK